MCLDRLSAAFCSVLAAIAAHNCRKPVRLIMPRNIDMAWSGGRNPFYFKYDVGYDDNGRMIATDVELYLNGGA